MAPLSTRVTAALANAPEGLGIFARYQQTPVCHKPVTVEAAPDEKGCLAVELPLPEARMVSVGPRDEVMLFLEPGDRLHIEADVLDLPGSLRFSGTGAGNNRFLAALRSRFPDCLRIDYKDLEADAFRRIIDRRRSELERFLDEGCSQYQLTPGFVAFYRAEITYEWASLAVSYPTDYWFANGNRNENLPADYFDLLDRVELADETAIGTSHYRTFLERNFWRMEEEAETRAFREQLSGEQRRAFIQPHTIAYLPDFIVRLDEEQRRGDRIQPHNIGYHLARRLLDGKVLYFFLAGEIVDDFQEGRFAQGELRLAEFLRDNPCPEYTEVVEEVVRETARLKPGQPAPDFSLEDLQGRSVSLGDFRGQAVFLDFWAGWCPPCVEAVPHLEEIKQRTRDLKVVFLNISLDPADEWHQAVEEHGVTGVHVHAPGGWEAGVAQSYQVQGIPSYFLVGPDGRMDGRVHHVSDIEKVVARIEEVVSGKVPSSKSGQSGIMIRG